jgi:hypothetical protein
MISRKFGTINLCLCRRNTYADGCGGDAALIVDRFHVRQEAQSGQIIVVDEDDNVIGEEDKEKCHDGDGILHRAFLAMVFNRAGELLLTRRSMSKKLWPQYWDGTVASHTVRGEDYEQASRRRLK